MIYIVNLLKINSDSLGMVNKPSLTTVTKGVRLMSLFICTFDGMCDKSLEQSEEVVYRLRDKGEDLNEYVDNLVTDIEGNRVSDKVIIISCDKEIRQSLERLKVNYVVVYPSLGFLQEYVNDTKKAKDEICCIQTEDFSERIALARGKYVEDIIEVLRTLGSSK